MQVRSRIRGTAIVLIIAGLALIAYGGYQLRALAWETVTGHVDSCTSRAVTDDNGMKGFQYTCVVSWVQGGAHHTASDIRFDERYDLSVPERGSEVELRVSGDQAVLSDVDTVAPLIIAGGVLVILAGIGSARIRRRVD